MMTQADLGVRGPSDREVVSHLQRLASARAHLLHAEQATDDAARQRRHDQIRIAEIEDAHANVLWAQAQLLTSTRTGRAQRSLESAVEAERRALRRHGHGSFASYLDQRTSTPTTDIALELARSEFTAAQAEWEALTAAAPAPADDAPAQAHVVRDEASATVVIDLTGANPRRIA